MPAETRQATGTPIRELFAHEDRIADLKRKVAILLQATMVMNQAIAENARGGQTICAYVGELTERVKRIELGGEVLP